MLKIAKRNLEWLPTLLAVVFLLGQVCADLYLPMITAELIDRGVVKNDLAYIKHAGLIMLGVALLGLLAAAVNTYFASTQAMRVGQKLRAQIFAKVLQFSNQEVSTLGDSSLITRSTNDIVQIQTVMFQTLRMMLQSPVMMLAAIVLAYHREPKLTVIFLISLPILALTVGSVMRRAIPLFRSIQKKTDRINLVFREGLTGVRVIRAFNQDQREQSRFQAANEDYTQTGIKAYTLVAFLFPVMTLILSLTNVGIIWYGAHLIAERQMQVGNLVSFLTYAAQILFSFMMLAMVFVFVPRGAAAAKRVNEVLDYPIVVQEPSQAQAVALPREAASLSFNHVNFRYQGAEKLSLTDVNFIAPAGTTVAIIGGTGSGKSTLVNLIDRLFDVESGQIKIGDQPINRLRLHDLHALVSITQQKAVLFSGTIRSNLQFGKPDATDEEIWQALKVAQAQDFVQAAGGLDAVVEQDGANFSGGQRQRLAIARTIIKPAAVYIFDDSFSALDFKTDAQLRHALQTAKHLQPAVKVIVAQRVSTVADADLILVMEDGHVVGQGDHATLKATNPTYQEIIASQLQKGDEADA